MTLPIDSELFGVVHRKQKINSKLKGNSNELKVAKILSEWTDHEFVRIPMSGGLRWRNREDVCGDLINTDKAFSFPFSIEAKHVASLGICFNHPRELRANSVVFKYFTQCQRDADVVGKIPFLIVRQNGMPEGEYYIFLHLSLEQEMKINNYIDPVFIPTYKSFLSGYKSKEFFSKITCDQLKWIFNKL